MMAYFAILDSEGNITNTIVVDQTDVDNNGGDQSTQAENWVKTNLLKDESAVIKQFSMDGSFRANQAEPGGGSYDSVNDVFLLRKPHDSWTLNTSNWKWEAPVTRPDNYTDPLVPDYICAPTWDEDTQKWWVFDTTEAKLIWNPDTSTWE